MFWKKDIFIISYAKVSATIKKDPEQSRMYYHLYRRITWTWIVTASFLLILFAITKARVCLHRMSCLEALPLSGLY